MTKFHLASLLFMSRYPANHATTIVASNGEHYTGFLCAIEREDGSGQSFNVTFRTPRGDRITIHVRTID